MKRLNGKGFWMAALASAAILATTSGVAADEAQIKETLAKSIDSNELLSDAAKTFAKEHLIPLCTNEVFVKETAAQNEAGTSLDEIKKIDAEWQAAEEPLDIQDEKLSNTTAKEIKKVAETQSIIREAFVMDNQGAVVGENLLTSDYWQGDEPKWSNSYAKGKGGVDVGKTKFDKSANASLQQVSLPVINPDGEVIGAVTYGLNVDKLN